MRIILVPVDGSPCAEKALSIALDLARSHDAAISLLHVLLREKEPRQLLALNSAVTDDEELSHDLTALENQGERALTAREVMSDPDTPAKPVPEALLQRVGKAILRRAQEKAAEVGIEARIEAIAKAPIAPAILAKAEDLKADAIVMGMRGLSLGEMTAVGSVSQAVGRNARCTLIAVH